MPRIGQNPMKWDKGVHHPERITATTIVQIPDLSGYWEQSRDVLELCITSMRESTKVPFDLMVLDNGSCQEIQDYLLELKRQKKIQFLILSENNLGKTGGWNLLFKAAPGEIVSYADSDVYFLPGWLEASLEVLEVFPEAGMVTAQPIAGGDISQLWTTKEAQNNGSISIQTGSLIPDKYLVAHLKGLGMPPGEFERRQQNRKDVLLKRGAVSAYATASHFQLTTTKKVIQALFPSSTLIPLGDDQQFDIEMKGLKLWRLSTAKYLVHHMGNRVPDLRAELPWLENMPEISAVVEQPRLRRNHKRSRHGLLQSTAVRKLLKKVNALSYRLLYDE